MYISSDYSSLIIKILRDELFAKYNKFGGDYLSDGEIEENKELFQNIDKNSDKRISKNEFEDFLIQLRIDKLNQTEERFLLENKEILEGKNTINTIKTMIESKTSYYSLKVEIEKFANNLISKWDQNNDKKLSRKEFWDGVEEFMKKDTDFNNFITSTDLRNKITGTREKEIINIKDLFSEILNKLLVNPYYNTSNKISIQV